MRARRAVHQPIPGPRTSRQIRAALRYGRQVAGAVGSTSVLWIDRPLKPEGRGFWAKLEGHNPGGMKDRARCTWSSAPASPVICHQAG